jgi:hypothetical protein
MNENKAEKTWNNAKSGMDRAVSDVKSDLKNMDPAALREVATEIGTKVRDVSTSLYSDSVGFLKRYPVSSALGVAAFGYLLGSLSARMRR